jgi:hypothetical protein
MHRFDWGVLAMSLITSPMVWTSASEGATLAGQTVQPGGTLEIGFSIDKAFQDVAAQGGNPRPTEGSALISFPKGFNPARQWPILVVTSTADGNRTSPMDAPFYQKAATAEGWIVLATDATIRPRDDSATWRLGPLAAALQTIRKEWPQAKRWTVAFAGFSGGAKSSEVIGAMLAATGGLKICGFFLVGINEDRLGPAYKIYHLPPDFLNTPIWLSSGTYDPRAPYTAHEHVRAALAYAGFKRVRLQTFAGGHQVQPAEVQLALRWFRQVGNF